MTNEEAKTILYCFTRINNLDCIDEQGFENIKEAVLIKTAELEKKDKIIDLMLQEFTDCEFELKCSNCNIECERDYDQLYECNKQYFEKQVEKE